MKRVYSSNAELAHVFCNRLSDDARANSMSISGNRLFSYGTVIAQWLDDVLIINTTSYSNTTSEHQSLLRMASRGSRIVYLSHIEFGTNELYTAYWQQDRKPLPELQGRYEKAAENLYVKASKARSRRDDYMAQAYNHLKEFQDYCGLFGVSYDIPDAERLQALAVEKAKEAERLEKERLERRKQEQAENLEKWRNGAQIYGGYFEVTALRLNGDSIETSRGASIPTDHAIKAWPMLKKLHERGENVSFDNHTIKLGHYGMRAFRDDCLIVGCHEIPFKEVSAIAAQLNLN